jgi:hypothetical protein
MSKRANLGGGAPAPPRQILGRKEADYEIESGVSHRPFGSQIRNRERQHRRPPRSLSRRVSGNIEAEADNRPLEGLYYPRR